MPVRVDGSWFNRPRLRLVWQEHVPKTAYAVVVLDPLPMWRASTRHACPHNQTVARSPLVQPGIGVDAVVVLHFRIGNDAPQKVFRQLTVIIPESVDFEVSDNDSHAEEARDWLGPLNCPNQ